MEAALDSDKLNRWLSLGANIGVVVGIIFLAIEIRQNNELLRTEVEMYQAQAREAKLDRRTGNSRLIASNPALAEAIYNYKSGEKLTPIQEVQIEAYQRAVLAAWEWQFNEYQRGRLDFNDLAIGSWRTGMSGTGAGPGLREFWDAEWHQQATPEFVKFLEENVIQR